MKRSRPELRAMVLAVSAAFADCALAQTTLPTNGTVAAGGASISTNGAGNAMTVTQTTSRTVINWDSFSLQNGSLTFNQPGSSSIAVSDPNVAVDPFELTSIVPLIASSELRVAAGKRTRIG